MFTLEVQYLQYPRLLGQPVTQANLRAEVQTFDTEGEATAAGARALVYGLHKAFPQPQPDGKLAKFIPPGYIVNVRVFSGTLSLETDQS